MKPNSNQRTAQSHIRLRSLRVVAAAGAALSLAIATASRSLAKEANPGVFPPDSRPFGATYGEWGGRWWQWLYSIPFHVNPSANDPTGAQCAINQSGPVWYLAGTTAGMAKRACTIPGRKAIFFPIINAINDYPCPEPPPFEPAPGQSVEDFLTQGAAGLFQPVTSLEVDLDGISLKDLFDFRATSKLFGFSGARDLNPSFDTCVTGSPQLGVADGYWIMLRPLPVGSHTLHFKGVGPFTTEVTYHLTIAD